MVKGKGRNKARTKHIEPKPEPIKQNKTKNTNPLLKKNTKKSKPKYRKSTKPKTTARRINKGASYYHKILAAVKEYAVNQKATYKTTNYQVASSIYKELKANDQDLKYFVKNVDDELLAGYLKEYILPNLDLPEFIPHFRLFDEVISIKEDINLHLDISETRNTILNGTSEFNNYSDYDGKTLEDEKLHNWYADLWTFLRNYYNYAVFQLVDYNEITKTATYRLLLLEDSAGSNRVNTVPKVSDFWLDQTKITKPAIREKIPEELPKEKVPEKPTEAAPEVKKELEVELEKQKRETLKTIEEEKRKTLIAAEEEKRKTIKVQEEEKRKSDKQKADNYIRILEAMTKAGASQKAIDAFTEGFWK